MQRKTGAKPMPRISWSNGPGFAHLTPPNGLIGECGSRNDPTGRTAQPFGLAALALRRSGLQRQGVQPAAHFGLERLVDDLVLLDP